MEVVHTSTVVLWISGITPCIRSEHSAVRD
jgi:hypothetical protein